MLPGLSSWHVHTVSQSYVKFNRLKHNVTQKLRHSQIKFLQTCTTLVHSGLKWIEFFRFRVTLYSSQLFSCFLTKQMYFSIKFIKSRLTLLRCNTDRTNWYKYPGINAQIGIFICPWFRVFVRRIKNYTNWERECINYAYSFDTRSELRPLITSPFSPINWIIDTCRVRVRVRGSIIKSTKKRRFPGSDGLHGTRACAISVTPDRRRKARKRGKKGKKRSSTARRSARKRRKIVSTITSANLISLTHISRIELVSKIDRGHRGKSGTNDWYTEKYFHSANGRSF